MQAQFAGLAKEMEGARNTPSLIGNANAIQAQIKQVNELRAGVNGVTPGFNALMQATGGWNVQTVKSITASQTLTKQIMDQKVSVGAAMKDWQSFKTTLREVANEQAALQKATAVQWTNSSTGKSMVDIYTPTSALADASTRMGVYMNALKAAGTQVQNWGKNTQWAGRQITAGFTMPLVLASAGLIALAKNTDTELTKIVKMYSTYGESIQDPAQKAIAVEQQLAQVRKFSMDNAITMAKQYGVAINDTLEIEAQMASKGFTGQGLLSMTNQVMKVSQIGAIAPTDAMSLVMSASSAFQIKPSEMSDAMNFLNALKNNTNLTMQDIATAVPKIGATIATLVPPTKDTNAALKETGILLAAFAQGGVPAAQGANSLRTAIARALSPVTAANKEFASLNTNIQKFQGAGGKGIDINKIVGDSGGDPLKLFQDLGQATKGLDPVQQEQALSKLFGVQRSNNLMVALKGLVNADPTKADTQVGKAMQLAGMGPGTWSEITDQEIQQFQQSASGKLKIATESIKAQLTQLGTPLLGMLTPVIHGLTGIVTVVQAIANGFSHLPGIIKTPLEAMVMFGAALGPIMMLVGIGANWVGTIGKIAAAVGLLGNKFKMQTAEMAAENTLEQTALQTKDKSAQATATLALRMKDLVTIMQERMDLQEKLNAQVAEGAAVDTEAAVATEKSAAATSDVVVAQEQVAETSALDVKAILAQVTAYNELTAAAREAALAGPAVPSVTGITGAQIGTGGFAVNSSGTATYSAQSARAAAQAAAQAGLSGTTGGNGRFYVYPNGETTNAYPTNRPIVPSETAAPWQARMAAQQALKGSPSSGAAWLAQATLGSAEAGLTSVRIDTSKIAAAAKTAGAELVQTAETSLTDEILAMGATSGAGTGVLGRLKNNIKGRIAPGGNSETAPLAVATDAQAAKNSEEIAANSAKAGVSWGRIAGNMGALAMGGMMIKSMSDGSGNIATNILQGVMAFSMIGPVLGNTIKGITAMRAASAAAAVEGQAGVGLMSAAFSKLKSTGTSAWNAIASSAKWLFTTGPGIAITALAVLGIAWYSINEQMTKGYRQQEEINKSTDAWSQIIGYTQVKMLAADGTVAKGVSAYAARANAVQQLADKNRSLVDSLEAAKRADEAAGLGGKNGNYTSTFNTALNEALKVKVDGGSLNQAKMAFDVALQAAGLDKATIDNLDVHFNKATLDDPKQLADQLNAQIALALKPEDGQDKQGGYWEQVWNKWFGPKAAGTIGRDLAGNHFVGLSDAAKKAASSAGDAVYNALANGIQNGDKGQVKGAMDSMNKAINDEFQSDFAGLANDGKYKSTFNKLGIKTMTDLQAAIAAAVNAPHKSQAQIDLLKLVPDLNKTDAYQAFGDTWKGMLTEIANKFHLPKDALNDFVNKAMTSKDVANQFGGDLSDSAAKIGDAFQQAGNQATKFSDAMDTSGAVATGQQYAQEMQNAYGGTISTYVSQANTAFSQLQQAAATSIQNAGDKRQAAMQAQQKQQDQAFSDQDKGITDHYKNLAAQYDADVKNATDTAKAKTDAINEEVKALQKQDQTRQKLFDAEKQRIQQMAQLANNNIDFNAALNSGNLDEAARVYNNSQSQVQSNLMSNQQQAMDDASKAQQDALQAQIDQINTERDAYVQAQQDKKSALSDMEQAEHDALSKQKQAYDDAMQARLSADQKATSSSIAASNNRYQKDKESIDLQIAAATAMVPATAAAAKAQVDQINGIYGKYFGQMKFYGDSLSGQVADDMNLNIAKAANALQSDVQWAQIGTFIQSQLDAGSGFTLDQALSYLKSGTWPDSTQPAPKPATALPPQRTNVPLQLPGTGASETGSGKMRGYATGGYTGDGGKFDPAGVVHRGEFVFPQEAVNRIGVEALNRAAFGRMPGYAAGGLVRNFAAGMVAGENAFIRADLMAAIGKKAAAEAYGVSQLTNIAAMGLGADIARFTGHGNSIANTLSFGKSQQGKPYVWGGAGPAGQDCSGFMSVLYNFLAGGAPKGSQFPWGRDWVTASFAGGREFGPWKRDNRNSNHKFRIGVDPGSHMAGTLGGINVESGSGHGPMVGGRALGANDKMFPFQYYLPLADLPQLRTGGTIQYDNTLANLHKGETVLTAPLTQALSDNVANGLGSTYNVKVEVNGVTNQIDFEQGVYNALVKLDSKNGRSRTIS